MTNVGETYSEREEIEMLLPWYVTGKLDAPDHARVEAYLAAHPDMRAQLELIEDERFATIMANEALPGMKPGALEALHEAIEAEKTTADRARQQASGLFAWVTDLFTAPTPSAVRWAGAAAAVLLVAQAVAIGSLVSTNSGRTDPSYTTATGSKQGTATGTRVLVQFSPTASAERISAALQAVGAEIVAGPKSGGVYEVRLSARTLSEAERDALIAQFKQNPGLVTMIVPQG